MTVSFDPPPEPASGAGADMIHYVSDGSGPPPWHVRDQEARILALPPCAAPPANRAGLTPVALGPYPATLWLPDPAAAEPMEVPDATWQGWDWPSGDSLTLSAHRMPGLPGLYALEGYAPGTCRAALAGRPVSVWRWSQEDADGTLHHRAVVGGFLDDATAFYAGVVAGSPEGRDALLAALLTLAPRP